MNTVSPLFFVVSSFILSIGKAQKYDFLPQGIQIFRRQNLELHNKFRRLHGAADLTYNDKLNKVAQDYADTLAARDYSNLRHSNNGYGENLMMSFGLKVDGNSAAQTWYDEVSLYSNYNQEQPDDPDSVGHFTQVVSRASCYMGVGVSKAKSGRVYVVANYDPPGNVQGGFRYNVFPPGGRNKSSLNNYEYFVSQPVCQDEDLNTLMKKNLECHNALREMHGVPSVVYDTELNKLAQSQVNYMAGQGKRILQAKQSYRVFIQIMNKAFKNGYYYCRSKYNDGRLYRDQMLGLVEDNLIEEGPAQVFTQMIWKSTRSIGYGIARSKDGKLFTAVAYNPPGNIRGEFKHNVLPQIADYTPVGEDRGYTRPSVIPPTVDNTSPRNNESCQKCLPDEGDYDEQVDNELDFKQIDFSTKRTHLFKSKPSLATSFNPVPAIYLIALFISIF